MKNIYFKYCPECGKDELKPYKKKYYCCYGCGAFLKIECEYNRMVKEWFKHSAI